VSGQQTASDPLFPDRPWTVCFYSFRGGVGRTTLAVTAAVNLAYSGSGVFLLDFDLEAPGIDEFEQLAASDCHQKGLVEYVNEYLRSESAPELREFVYPVGATPSANKVHPRRDGQLYVMRAGRRDATHRKFLAQHDWQHFYRFEDGWLFFENLRAGLRKEFGCDYMLVDSRAGLSEIASVCLGHLADAVVLVFQPTTAHQQGLIDVVAEIRKREQREQRPIPRLYVACKAWEPYEGEIDHDVGTLVSRIVEQCEGTAELNELPDPNAEYADLELDTWRPDLQKPTVHFIRYRERVKGQHRPDAYLVRYAEQPYVVTPLAREYEFVQTWITAGCAEVRRLPERRRGLQPSLVRELKKLGVRRLEKELQGDPELRETVRDLPPELIGELSQKQQAVLIKVLAKHGMTPCWLTPPRKS